MYDGNVRIGDGIFLYREKAPFVSSGYGEMGALRLDATADRVMCHECGQWFIALFNHVVRKHQMNAERYKRVHGLSMSTALVSEGYRRGLVAVGERNFLDPQMPKPPSDFRSKRSASLKGRATVRKNGRVMFSSRNVRGTCPVQIPDMLQKLCQKLGRVPEWKDIKKHLPINPRQIEYRFGSVARALVIAGCGKLRAAKDGDDILERKFSEDQLLQLVKNAALQLGRCPRTSDCRRGFLPSHITYRKVFGSWTKALELAGQEPSIHAYSNARHM